MLSLTTKKANRVINLLELRYPKPHYFYSITLLSSFSLSHVAPGSACAQLSLFCAPIRFACLNDPPVLNLTTSFASGLGECLHCRCVQLLDESDLLAPGIVALPGRRDNLNGATCVGPLLVYQSALRNTSGLINNWRTHQNTAVSRQTHVDTADRAGRYAAPLLGLVLCGPDVKGGFSGSGCAYSVVIGKRAAQGGEGHGESRSCD